MQGDLDYADALKILGEGNYKTLETLDGILGGAIIVTSAATGQIGFLGLLEARDELIRHGRKLLARIGQRVRGATGKGRTDLLIAAHAVVAVNGFFEALKSVKLPIDWQSLKLSGAEKLMFAGASSSDESAKLVDAILRLPVPAPTPSKPYEAVVDEIRLWYLAMSQRMLDFMKGLAVWESLDERKQSTLENSLLVEVPSTAALRYEESFRKLTVACPEFKMWIYLTDSAASRTAIETLGGNIEIGLAGLQKILEGLAAGRQSAEWPVQLSRAYRAQLDRPIAETSPGEALAGLVVPTLGTGYINPRLRVAEYGPDASPAEEAWWSNAVLNDDVQWFLAGYLTSPAATEAPLVILGQPGSGKSLLTKVLAARLPPDEYLPIRVELRHVPADAPIQDQIEFALREATHERMDWLELLRQAGDALVVVMLDGFDELLQSTGLSHSGYLEQVRNFQRAEIAQRRRVAFIVTSRTIVANRIRFPEGTVIAKMEPFNGNQINNWINIWNSANVDYFRRAKLQPLAVSTILGQRYLAEQPLLLLMLSFYDADGNALQQRPDELALADLYEGLLTKFVDREIDKGNTDLAPDEKQVLADTELDELSVVAFAMFNRSRKSVSEEDLDTDLDQLLPYDDVPGGATSRMARRLSRAQMAVGRFFFIHRSQAILDDMRINDYEFLHATFGEYLVARLVHKILAHFITLSKTDKPSRVVRSTSVIDDTRLWDLLSFAPLTDGSQTVPFLSEFIRKFDPEYQADLRLVLSSLFRRSLGARERGYKGYEPRPSSVPVRHAVYSANLLVLSVCASPDGVLRASTLFGSHARVVDAWRSYALLWKSQFDSADWDGLINSLNIRHTIQDTHDLTISYEPVRLTKPIEHFETVNWMVEGTKESQDSGIGTDKVGWQAIFLCAPELDLLIHALQPLLRISPRAFRELAVNSEGNARSAMNMILSALITAAQAGDESASSRRRVAQWLARYSSSFDYRLLTSVGATTVSEEWSKSESNLTQLPLALKQASVLLDSSTIIHTLTTGISEGDQEIDEFAVLRLYLSNYSRLSELKQSIPGIGDISRIYSEVNPISLASEDNSFVAEVLKVARLNGLRDWAALQGLAMLSVIDSEKLATLSREDVEFVLTSSASNPAQSRLIALISDRYDGAVH